MTKLLLPFFLVFCGCIFLTSTAQSQTTSTIPVVPSGTSSKFEKSDKFEYYLSGLKTVADATNIENIFKSRPGILDATVNLTTHKIVIFSVQGMLESDIMEVIKFANKKIITEQEIQKYY